MRPSIAGPVIKIINGNKQNVGSFVRCNNRLNPKEKQEHRYEQGERSERSMKLCSDSITLMSGSDVVGLFCGVVDSMNKYCSLDSRRT